MSETNIFLTAKKKILNRIERFCLRLYALCETSDITQSINQTVFRWQTSSSHQFITVHNQNGIQCNIIEKERSCELEVIKQTWN